MIENASRLQQPAHAATFAKATATENTTANAEATAKAKAKRMQNESTAKAKQMRSKRKANATRQQSKPNKGNTTPSCREHNARPAPHQTKKMIKRTKTGSNLQCDRPRSGPNLDSRSFKEKEKSSQTGNAIALATAQI